MVDDYPIIDMCYPLYTHDIIIYYPLCKYIYMFIMIFVYEMYVFSMNHLI